MKAVFLDYATMGPGVDLQPLRSLLPDLEIFDETADDLITARIRDAEFVFANKIHLSPDQLRQASSLRFVGLTATGTDRVDLASAAQHGVAVCNIRDYCTASVVEHVFGVLLMLTHNLERYAAAVRAGRWQRADDFCMLAYPIRELSAMTLGVVGYGALGRGVADVAQAFGMEVLVAARRNAAAAEGRVAFDELLQRADIISLHCPLNDETENLIDADAIAHMKPGALLINTARGGLVDSQALVDGLESGHLGGAAIDVLPKEPPRAGNPLLDYEGTNLIVTPHIAWGSIEARQKSIDEVATNVAAFLRGERRNRVV